MRYYDIEINGVTKWTSHPYGAMAPADPGALDIEFNFPIQAKASPTDDGGWLRVWGIGFEDINQNSLNYMGAEIKVWGGMTKPGLPLANPLERGLLIQGFVWQVFSNWIGKDMGLEFIIKAGESYNSTPNLSFYWQKGTDLYSAITKTLQQAFPLSSLFVAPNISSFISPEDQQGVWKNLKEFAQYIVGITKQIKNNPNQGGGAPGVPIPGVNGGAPSGSVQASTDNQYKGVNIYTEKGWLKVMDQDTPVGYQNIDFQDLIGQPTWINNNELGMSVQVKTVMRGDFDINDNFLLPATRFTTQAGAYSVGSLEDLGLYLSFTGYWEIQRITHIGQFRSPAPEAWVTIFEGIPALDGSESPAVWNAAASLPSGAP